MEQAHRPPGKRKQSTENKEPWQGMPNSDTSHFQSGKPKDSNKTQVTRGQPGGRRAYPTNPPAKEFSKKQSKLIKRNHKVKI
jgi:hypothetical protein